MVHLRHEMQQLRREIADLRWRTLKRRPAGPRGSEAINRNSLATADAITRICR